jgi:tetratricopeptide (TPR) repeat protein
LSQLRYKAFISYSHQDESWARWSQRALERYRVPRRLVGEKGEYGTIPARLSPVFRDREDLSSASDLSNSVKEELAQSEALVVICSPAAAESRWVNEEIRHFISLGRLDRIYALIVDGDAASRDPGKACFPLALLEDAEGREREPLAADVRNHADGKLLSKLKLVSGILGIRLDDLRQRDMQRRHRLWMASSLGAMSLALIMAVLAVMAITARNAAENRRAHAENLVGYMVGDLKSKLDEVGRLDILEGVGGEVSDYLKTLNPDEVTEDSLLQQARVWLQLGQVSKDQGKLDDALDAFSASRDLLAELHHRFPGETLYLFELGNAEFWVGYIHLIQGEFELAREAFQAYLGHAERLNEIEPGNPKWLMEISYAHNNIAALIKRSGADDVGQALNHARESVEVNRRVIELAPENNSYWSEYSNHLAWLADIQLLSCSLDEALATRQEQLDVARRQMEMAPGNINYRRRFAYSLSGVAGTAAMLGLIDLAANNYTMSGDILQELSILEPANVDFRFEYLMREARHSNLIARTGESQGPLKRMEQIYEPLKDVLVSEGFENLRHNSHWIIYLLNYSELAWQAGRNELAESLLTEAIRQLGVLMENVTDFEPLADQILTAKFQNWQQRGEPSLELDSVPDTAVLLENNAESCLMREHRARMAVMRGERQQAAELADELLGKGYLDPGFIAFCREFEICSVET